MDDTTADDLHADHGEEVDRLVAAASEYWDGDDWAINQKLWSDGDTDAYAYKNVGRDIDGTVEQERLYVTDAGIQASKVVFQRTQIDEQDLGSVGNK